MQKKVCEVCRHPYESEDHLCRKAIPGPILKEGETPRGAMLLAGPEYRETIIYILGPERQQYARLFSAAPELLTELIAAMELLEDLCDRHLRHSAAVTRALVQKRIDAARDAIAKATGQEG